MKKGAKVFIPVCFAVLSTPAFAKAVQAADNDSSPPVQDVALTAYQQQYVDVNPGSYLNVRQSPSTHAPVIARLMRGTEVTVTSIQNGWAKVKVDGKEGYVSTTYLTPLVIDAVIPEKTTAKYVHVDPGSRLNLRKEPSLNAPIVAMLPRGTKVEVLSESNGWAKVKVNGKTGYVSAQYLKSNSGNNSGGGSTEKVIATKYVSVNPGSN